MIKTVLYLNSWMMIIKLRGYQEQIKCIKFHEKLVGISTHLMHILNNETFIRVNFVSALYCKKLSNTIHSTQLFSITAMSVFLSFFLHQVLRHFLMLDVIWILLVNNGMIASIVV